MKAAEKLIGSLLQEGKVAEAEDAWEVLEQLDSQLDRALATATEGVQYTSTTKEERELNAALKDVVKQLSLAKKAFDKAKSIADDFAY